jgi:Uma2 family endonuclease
MTTAEFDSLWPQDVDDRYRYELINGVLVVSPFPGIGERGPNDFLGYLIQSYFESRPAGPPFYDTLPEQTIITANRRRADRVIWAKFNRKPDLENDFPSIIIEFVSAARRRDAIRDYETKRDEYLAAGVKEYWIIDRFRRVMTVYFPAAAGPIYVLVAENQSYETNLLPGFTLPLARILEKADMYAAARAKRSVNQTNDKSNPAAGGSDG